MASISGWAGAPVLRKFGQDQPYLKRKERFPLPRSTIPLRAVADRGPLIGAHMSIAGGMTKAIERGLAVGARAIQVFTRNTNQWAVKPLAAGDVDAFHEAWEASGLSAIVAHDSYLINLASPDQLLRERSIRSFAEELGRCEALGIPALVTHPGAHMGSGVREGCLRVAESLDRARSLAPAPSVMVLLETVAGQGTTLGRRFEELASIRSRVARANLVGFCFDTCHVHAAGYDLVTDTGFEETLQEFDATLGLENLRAFHLNDSKRECGSRVDRHEAIGKGHLGPAPFRRILQDSRFRAVPKLLETPKGDDGVTMDRKNLALLRRLAAK